MIEISTNITNLWAWSSKHWTILALVIPGVASETPISNKDILELVWIFARSEHFLIKEGTCVWAKRSLKWWLNAFIPRK